MLRQIKTLLSFKRISACVGLIVFVVIATSDPLAAQSTTPAVAPDGRSQQSTSAPADTNSNLPEFLESIVDPIAGQQVSSVRVYTGLFILIAAAAIAGSLLYFGIKNSASSIVTSPLSKKSVSKSLAQIVFTAIIIFLIGLFGVYLLLRL